MGKKWDRLGDVGAASGGFSPGAKAEPGVRGEIRALPQYKPSGNVRCRNCGKWKIGHVVGDSGGGGLKCSCNKPDFPNVGLQYSQRMQAWHEQWLTEAFRVLVPGGVIKAFSGTRTFHRLAAAMEAVGFTEIGLVAWNYGSGFPKSLDVSKAIDKLHGVEREVVGTKHGVGGENLNDIVAGVSVRSTTEEGAAKATGAYGVGAKQVSIDIPVTAPATDEAKRWKGWGTAMKPSWEPVLVAKKPIPESG